MKRRLFLLSVVTGLLLTPATSLAIGGIDETGEGGARPPSTTESQQRQQEAVEEAARIRAATPTSTPPATPRTGGVPATQLTPSIPQLAVPIPGVTITAPTQNSDGTISVPYLAQYISGIYRYLLGISTIVAIIMVIYGGFLYLLANTGIQVASGKTIIQDALIGLVVLYGSYFILWNVNPDLVNLRPITLQSIRSVALETAGEGATADVPPDGVGDPRAAQCSLIKAVDHGRPYSMEITALL